MDLDTEAFSGVIDQRRPCRGRDVGLEQRKTIALPRRRTRRRSHLTTEPQTRRDSQQVSLIRQKGLVVRSNRPNSETKVVVRTMAPLRPAKLGT